MFSKAGNHLMDRLPAVLLLDIYTILQRYCFHMMMVDFFFQCSLYVRIQATCIELLVVIPNENMPSEEEF